MSAISASGSWGRSSRRFCIIFITRLLKPSESDARRFLGGSGYSVTCLVITTIGLAPEKGVVPVDM